MKDSALQNKRLTAAAIDIGIGFALVLALGLGSVVLAWLVRLVAGDSSALASYLPRILGFANSILVLGFVLGRDLLGGGRSLGKKVQEIRVLTAAGGPISTVESIKRNAIFAVGPAVGVISGTLGLLPCLGDLANCLLTPLWLLAAVVGIAAAVVEILKITQEPAGTRFGDQMAGTKVTF